MISKLYVPECKVSPTPMESSLVTSRMKLLLPICEDDGYGEKEPLHVQKALRPGLLS